MRTVIVLVVALVMVMAVAGSGWAETSTSSAASATVTTSGLVNLELENVPVVDGIRTLFHERGLSYIINPGVKGRIVELTLKGVTFEQAVKAFFDAANLKYVIEEGTYIISPSKPAQTTAQKSTAAKDNVSETRETQDGSQQQLAEGDLQAGTGQPQPAQAETVVAPNTSVYVTQNAPVVYGHPAGLGIIDAGDYFGPPRYQAGNLRFLYGWPPVVLGSDMPYVMNFGQGYPPPQGWVNPEMMRLMRAQWAFQPQPYFITPY